MLYTSETKSLAVLEVLVHYDDISDLPHPYTLLEIEIPEKFVSIKNIDSSELPDNWDTYTFIDRKETQDIGTKWLMDRESLLLTVPSAINPYERNYLINPLHDDFNQVSIKTKLSYDLEDRVIQRILDPPGTSN